MRGYGRPLLTIMLWNAVPFGTVFYLSENVLFKDLNNLISLLRKQSEKQKDVSLYSI